MPATLSAIPDAGATGAAAGRALQVAHVVVPSAICAPHILQNAIGIPPDSSLKTRFQLTGTAFGPEQHRGKVSENRGGSNQQLKWRIEPTSQLAFPRSRPRAGA